MAGAEEVDPKFAALTEFTRLNQNVPAAAIAPAAISERIAELKPMDDGVYIYGETRLD